MKNVFSAVRHVHPAILAGSVVLGSFGYAMAGADDGGSRSFWNVPAMGSASGMPQTEAPDTHNPAAAAQPNTSISRTGVAQDQAQAAHRHEAISHPANASVARRQVRSTLTAEHGSARNKKVMHALHRATETNGTQS